MSETKETPAWALGCAAILLTALGSASLIAIGIFVGWLIWG